MSGEQIDTTITCKHCGNDDMNVEVDVQIDNVYVYGRCLKCGYSVCTHEEFVGSKDVNDDRYELNSWEEIDHYTYVDDLYLFTNRYKKVPFDQKMIELGLVTKEEIKQMDERMNKIHGKKIEVMKKLEKDKKQSTLGDLDQLSDLKKNLAKGK